MVSDSDLPQSQLLPPAKGHWPSLSELESSPFTKRDVKTLAARRKRSEIRRFKLMTAAHEEAAEPLLKRSKAMPEEGFDQNGHSISTLRMPTASHHPDYGRSVTGGAADVTDASKSAVDAAMGVVSNKDDRGGSDMQSRPAVSVINTVCPSHCVVSICGRSRVMEDAAIAVPSFLAMPSSVIGGHGCSSHTDTFHFFGVYDGHGGAQAAEFCKERMHGVLAEEMGAAANCSPPHLESCMQACFQRLDDELCGVCPHGSQCPRKADGGSGSCREPLVPGSVGTTAVVALVGAKNIVVGNCGDSRAVLSRGGEAVPLSFDHKASRPDEIARIEAAGGQVFTWEGHRVCGVLAMSRALGDGFLKPFVSGQPDVMVAERSDDDECLILASDGLWDVLPSEYVCSVAREAMANWRMRHRNFQHRYPLFSHRSEEGGEPFNDADVDAENSPAQVVASLLVKLALAKKSADNISVVVVDLKRV